MSSDAESGIRSQLTPTDLDKLTAAELLALETQLGEDCRRVLDAYDRKRAAEIRQIALDALAPGTR